MKWWTFGLCKGKLNVQAREQPAGDSLQPAGLDVAETCTTLQQAGEFGLLLGTEALARSFLGWRPPSAPQASAWGLMSRCSTCRLVRFVDLVTGLCSFELALCCAVTQLPVSAMQPGSWPGHAGHWLTSGCSMMEHC